MASSVERFTALRAELAPQLKGSVLLRECSEDAEAFGRSVKLFNSAVKLVAKMVIRPKHTQDVVTAIRFCRAHSLSPSIKSGGFATAGWSIQGDVVIDMSSLDDVALIHPDAWKPWEPQAAAATGAGVGAEATLDIAPGQEARPVEAAAAITKANGMPEVSAVRTESVRAVDLAHVESQQQPDSLHTTQVQTLGAEILAARAQAGEAAAPTASPLPMSPAHTGSGSSARTRKADEAFPSPEPGEASAATRRRTDNASETMPPAGETSGSADVDAHAQVQHERPVWVDRGEGHARRMPSTESEGGQSGGSGSRSGNGSGSGSGSSHGHSAAGTAKSSIHSESPAVSGDKVVAPSPPPISAPPTSTATHSPPAEGVPWMPSGEFEFDRWQRHHRPPVQDSASSPATSRVVLPASGGFIWREGQDGSASQALPWDGAGFANSTATAWPAAAAVGGLHAGDPSNVAPVISLMGGLSGPASNGTNRTPDELSPPAPQVLPYVLCSIGPGAGIRGIDSFTDRAGRTSTFVSDGSRHEQGVSLDKGEGKAVEGAQVRATEMGIEVTAGGVPYHVPLSAYPVGSASIMTGGFGVQTRLRGLSLQNVVEVEMVLADGHVVTLNEGSKSRSSEEADLWWAVRGASPCFGAVTRMVVKAFPVPSGVYSATLIYPLSPTCSSLLRHWRDCLKGAGLPRELYANAILTAGPERNSSVVVFQICSLGAPEHGEALVEALSSWSGERVLLKSVEPNRSFVSQQDSVAQVLKSGDGRRWTVRGDLITTLTDECIAETVSRFGGMGTRAVWIFELVGGAGSAMADALVDDDTCLGREARSAQFTVGALQQWTGEAEDAKCQASVDGWIDVLKAWSCGGPLACFLDKNEPRSRCEGAFGKDNFNRLLQIKRNVDPDNVFRHTFAGGLGAFAEAQAAGVEPVDPATSADALTKDVKMA